MLCIHNNSLMLNHIFAFTLPEIQDVSKKGTFPDFDVPFPVTGTGMTNSNPIFGNGNGNENSIKFHSLFREREWEWKIPFPTFGTGIGGRYSREFPGSGIPAHGWFKVLKNGPFLKTSQKLILMRANSSRKWEILNIRGRKYLSYDKPFRICL